MNVFRSLAYALLDVLMGDDKHNRRISVLSRRGFIRHCFDAFDENPDATLRMMLSADDGMRVPRLKLYFMCGFSNFTKFCGAEAMREAYVFESKLSMLLRIAQTAHGAGILVDNGIFQHLIDCQFIDQRPDYAILAGTCPW